MKDKPSPQPWSWGRYTTGKPDHPRDGPIRIWDANGMVVADLPVTEQGELDADYICVLARKGIT